MGWLTRLKGTGFSNEANDIQQQSHPSSCSCSEQDLRMCRNEEKVSFFTFSEFAGGPVKGSSDGAGQPVGAGLYLDERYV